MTRRLAAIADVGMDARSMAGTLRDRLAAVRAAGFSQILLSARDLVGHPDGLEAAVRAVRDSDLRVTALSALRDYEGLQGRAHHYKVDIAKSLLQLCRSVGAPVLLTRSSVLEQASGEIDAIARDLRKLAMLAVPLGIRIAYEASSRGRHVADYAQAWDVVERADTPNLGVAIGAFHTLAAGTPLEALDPIPPERIFLVRLADFLWPDLPAGAQRALTARRLRVFPGEGAHSDAIAGLVRCLDELGYRGDYSLNVFNDDYRQLPLSDVTDRARRAAEWLADDVLRRAVPLPQDAPMVTARRQDA